MTRLMAISLAATALLASATPAFAAQPAPVVSTFVSAKKDLAPLGEVHRRIKERWPGCNILNSRLDRSGPRAVYVVRIMTRQGQRLDVIADAESGRILGTR